MSATPSTVPFPATARGAKGVALAQARFIDLTTFRQTGEPVSTTVLLIPDGARLLVRTAVGSGKVKRIRHAPRVEVTPSDQRGRHLGQTVGGTATILGPEAVGPTLARLHARYRIAGPLFSVIRRLRRQPDAILEITLDVPLPMPQPLPATAADDVASDVPTRTVDVDDVTRARTISGVTAAIAAAFLMGACSSAAGPATIPVTGEAGAAFATAPVAVAVAVDTAGGAVDTADGESLCAIVARDEVERVLGVPMDEGVATDQGIVSGASCRYASVDGHTHVSVWVHKPLTRVDWDASMAKVMTDGTAVAGLGEAARLHVGTPVRPRARLATFDADHDVWVDIAGAPDQDAATAAVQALAQRVLVALSH